ncbi:MAG: SpoIIE family protein phosphatase [Bacteroidetes bacterium]|nr:SpoIIE family protein phosphatase [Bacteroidota bacterium]
MGWLSPSNNIGAVYHKQNDLVKALSYYQKSLKMHEEVQNKQGIALTMKNIGTVCFQQNKISEAFSYCSRSLNLSKEIGYPESIRNAAEQLKKIYEAQGKPAEALKMFELYVNMRDSINNQETKKAALKSQFKYAYEKKEQEIRSAQEKKDLKADEEKQRQVLIRNSFIGAFVLALILSIFILKNYREKQQANAIIITQKQLVEKKHKEITDSINYAERIQRSFLATEKILTKNLKEHFVFFQPKDVVSGDFYWASELNNGNFLLATADSTGHGVPGAIMSILNISSLENSVEEKHLVEPAQILNHTRTKIIERLKKDGSSEGGKDGMDCSLISFDFKNKKLTYAAANSPVWIVRNGSLLVLEHDKIPVSKHDRDSIPFTQHTINLQTGDMVYAITDGMPDQFGGPTSMNESTFGLGKKFMYKKLKELLISIAQLPAGQQKASISAALNNWKGDQEQTDDVTVIGIRV